MKTLYPALFFLLLTASILGCKKSTENDHPLLVHSFPVENIIGPDGEQSMTNKCFINLYEGLTYTSPEANTNSSKVDFAYNYRGGGCESCRWFENVSQMSSRTWYVEYFSTITNSRIGTAERDSFLTVAEFDALQTEKDLDRLFGSNPTRLNPSADVTDRQTDAAANRVFTFIDKDGRKGVFKISDYMANVPAGDKATLTLTVKMKE